MAGKKTVLRRAIVKAYPKRMHQPVNVYNVYIDKIQIGEQPKEPNPFERILRMGMTLIRMLIMWLA